MAAGNTFVPIVSFGQLSSPYSIDVTNIPSTYTDLFIVVEFSGDRDGDVVMQFNGDTGANYGHSYIRANQNSASAITGGANSQTSGYFSLNGGWRGSLALIWIPRYKDTGKYKSWVSRSGGWESTAYAYTDIYGGTWRNTAAITSIKFLWTGGRQFSSTVNYGTKINIFGIAEA
jgi:hypothetical protein